MTITITERKIVDSAKLHTVAYDVDGAPKAVMLVDMTKRDAGSTPVEITNYTDTKDLSDNDLVTWITNNIE